MMVPAGLIELDFRLHGTFHVLFHDKNRSCTNRQDLQVICTQMLTQRCLKNSTLMFYFSCLRCVCWTKREQKAWPKMVLVWVPTDGAGCKKLGLEPKLACREVS